MKLNEFLPLTQQEIEVLQEAYARYGPRWPVISRYYQIRTPEFLEAEFTKCDRLLRKRVKEGVVCGYEGLRELLEGGRKKAPVELMEVEEAVEEGREERVQEESME
jgi:hypothetical protein